MQHYKKLIIKIKLKRKLSILKSYMKMEKTIIKLGDIEIQKQTFHQHKGPVSIKNVDTDKIVVSVVSNKVPFGKKGFEYFIGDKDARILNLYVCFS